MCVAWHACSFDTSFPPPTSVLGGLVLSSLSFFFPFSFLFARVVVRVSRLEVCLALLLFLFCFLLFCFVLLLCVCLFVCFWTVSTCTLPPQQHSAKAHWGLSTTIHSKSTFKSSQQARTRGKKRITSSLELLGVGHAGFQPAMSRCCDVESGIQFAPLENLPDDSPRISVPCKGTQMSVQTAKQTEGGKEQRRRRRASKQEEEQARRTSGGGECSCDVKQQKKEKKKKKSLAHTKHPLFSLLFLNLSFNHTHTLTLNLD